MRKCAHATYMLLVCQLTDGYHLGWQGRQVSTLYGLVKGEYPIEFSHKLMVHIFMFV